ncbi:hypothetical protein U1Q18_030590, partial [Sarracenia purpurea var. burkii]
LFCPELHVRDVAKPGTNPFVAKPGASPFVAKPGTRCLQPEAAEVGSKEFHDLQLLRRLETLSSGYSPGVQAVRPPLPLEGYVLSFEFFQ